MRIAKKGGVLALCFAMVFLFVGCGTGPNTQDLSGIIRTNYPKVVSIETFRNLNAPRIARVTSGSGVIIYATADFSLVATNAHVVWDDDNNKLHNYFSIISWSSELYNGEVDPYDHSSDAMGKYTVRNVRGAGTNSQVLYCSLKEDLAIIKYTPPTGFRNNRAQLRGHDKPVRVGEPVAAMGYSFGEFYRSSVGVITNVFPEYATPDRSKVFSYAFMHDAITISGNSGGPVFDAEGNLLGLTTMVVVMERCACDMSQPGNQHSYHCEMLAMGFSLSISARHIADVMNNPGNQSWFV